MKNKTKKIALGLLSIILFLLSGCFGETDCPGYSREYLNWMPYIDHNYMKFTNGVDTVRFVVENASYSDSYSFKNNCDCDCEASAYFTTCIANEIDLEIEGHSYYGSSLDINYEYNFIQHGYSGDYYVAEKSDDFYFSKENGIMSDSIISEFIVNDFVYQNVIKLNISSSDINRIYVADSVGIIQFEYNKTGVIWTLINE